MKKKTEIKKCPVCGVQTAALIPTGKDSPLGEIYKIEYEDCCHKPVGAILHRNRHDPVPRSQFPLPGYICEECFQRIGRESDERAATALKAKEA